MNYEHGFRTALIVSLIVHSVVLISLPRIADRNLTASLKKLEITYYKFQVLSNALKQKLNQPDLSRSYKDSLAALRKSSLPKPPPFKPDIGDSLKGIEAEQKKPLTVKQFVAKKKITLPPVKSEKIKNPVYNNYYQMVREKIRHRAYNNYSRYETGEVYVTFMVASDGSLKGVKLIEEKSRAGEYLQNIALRSIRDASPFPAFPSDLRFPELSFNVIISFEISD